jgi:hypothetical protein
MPSKGQSHHYRTFATLPKILGKDTDDDSEYLEKCRVKRNAAEYDSANEASDTEGVELLEFVKVFEKTVRTWLKKNHPHLV